MTREKVQDGQMPIRASKILIEKFGEAVKAMGISKTDSVKAHMIETVRVYEANKVK